MLLMLCPLLWQLLLLLVVSAHVAHAATPTFCWTWGFTLAICCLCWPNERVRQTVRVGLVSGLSKGRQQQQPQQQQLAWRVFACGSECSNINCGKLTKRGSWKGERRGRRLKWSQPAVTHPNTHTHTREEFGQPTQGTGHTAMLFD